MSQWNTRGRRYQVAISTFHRWELSTKLEENRGVDLFIASDLHPIFSTSEILTETQLKTRHSEIETPTQSKPKLSIKSIEFTKHSALAKFLWIAWPSLIKKAKNILLGNNSNDKNFSMRIQRTKWENRSVRHTFCSSDSNFKRHRFQLSSWQINCEETFPFACQT